MSLTNPTFRLILGDFNSSSNSWWEGDISTKESIDLESVSSSYGLDQLITDATHVLPQSSSCIDLIFIDQPNLVIESGVHSSLYANCYHQITHCKLNLKIVFPFPYERLAWNCKKADVTAMRKSLDLVNWDYIFLNKRVRTKSLPLIRFWWTFLTVYPRNLSTLMNKIPRGWMTTLNRKSNKKTLFKQYFKNSKPARDYQNLQFGIAELSDYITERKSEYNFQWSHSPVASAKTYWTILKTFYSGNKIPLIPSLVINDQLITNFWEKANFFNLYLAKQCTPIENDSSIPTETKCLCDTTISVQRCVKNHSGFRH